MLEPKNYISDLDFYDLQALCMTGLPSLASNQKFLESDYYLALPQANGMSIPPIA